jgi:hypothetical protein
MHQKERQAERQDRNNAASDFLEQLIDKWVYTNDKCINHKAFCFVVFNGKHHSFNTTQREAWAKDVA